MSFRKFSMLDRLLCQVDNAARTLFAENRVAARPRPDQNIDYDKQTLTQTEKKLSGRLLRVDHAGEVCAQALYHGQAMVTKTPKLAERLQVCANEENDHLAWCEQRLAELGARPSILGPLWYGGSFAIGAIAGLVGDRWSLGFVVETEQQVMEHLADHLRRLPENDYKSRVILQQMQTDEGEHASKALEAGAATLPTPVKKAMKCTAKLMTEIAYWG